MGFEKSGPGSIAAVAAFLVNCIALGVLIYRFYYETFEKRGTEAGVRGLAFFFGLAFIIEVGLILGFGVDQRFVGAGGEPGHFLVDRNRLVGRGERLDEWCRDADRRVRLSECRRGLARCDPDATAT